MQNVEQVTSSVHKHESHRRINQFLGPWIAHQFFNDALIITMPANSGRQERMLLHYMFELEKHYARGDGKICLRTYDRKYNAQETGIGSLFTPEYARGKGAMACRKYWDHMIRECIMDELATLPSGMKACWLDLTGGLTDKTRAKIGKAVQASFNHGSLLFVTLQVHGVRGLTDSEYTRQVYSSCTNTVAGKVIITDSIMKETVLLCSNNNKYLRTITAPYVYQNNSTTYAVYKYLVCEYE